MRDYWDGQGREVKGVKRIWQSNKVNGREEEREATLGGQGEYKNPVSSLYD